jgi:hypothetical protein
MNARCIHKSNDPVPPELVALGSTPSTRFDVKYGAVYEIYGICLFSRVLHYLVINEETNRPDWTPACLFEVMNARFSQAWHYSYWGPNNEFGVEAVWGYSEMVTSPKHYVDLIEREAEALELFQRRCAELETNSNSAQRVRRTRAT